MTQDEYLRYQRAILDVDNNSQGEEDEGEDVLETVKNIGKDALIAGAASIPGAYLTGSGKAIGTSFIGGSIAGGISSFLKDKNDKSIKIPAIVGAFTGPIIGSKYRIDELANENKNMKQQIYNQNMSKVKDFFKSYTKEGIENFSKKLVNFMVLSEIGATNAILNAPEGEKIRYGTHGAVGGLLGGGSLGIASAGAGVSAGALAGFMSGNKISDRFVKAAIGGAMGGVSAGTAGGILGSKLGSDQMIERLKEEKIHKLMQKAALKKYLTEEEKELLKKYMKMKKRKRVLELTKDAVEDYDVNFSSVGNLWKHIKKTSNELWDTNIIDAPDKKPGYFKRHPVAAKFVLGVPLVTAFGGGATATAYGINELLEEDSSPDDKKREEDLASGLMSAAGGAMVGGVVGEMSGGDPLISAGVGGLVSAIGSGLTSHVSKDPLLSAGVGIGSSALATYLLSKKMKKEKNLLDSLSEKKGPGRPPKKEDLELFD